MADNYEKATIQPSFPQQIVDAHLDKLQNLGVKIFNETPKPGFAYLCIPDGCWDWDELHNTLQEMLAGADMKYCYVEGAMYCDKMIANEFGGFAHFITKDDIQFCNTGSWVMKREAEVNTGDQKL